MINNLSTQIATNCEQSERLLTMGVKSETADCYIEWIIEEDWNNYETGAIESWMNQKAMFESESKKPAWSLSRLISMMPTNIDGYILSIDFENKGVEFSKTNCCDGLDWLYIKGYENLFDGIIDCFDWQIRNNHFNKEYLK